MMEHLPTKEQLGIMPGLGATQDIEPKNKLIHLHFFLAGIQWYAAEYDPRTEVFYGFVVMANDYLNSEWEYFSLQDLKGLRWRKLIEVELNPYFNPKVAGKIETIRDYI